MTHPTPFSSPAHAERFFEAATLYRRGSPQAPVCGARLRSGAACQNPPIREGKGRCLSHAGPHAARAFRERQKRRFEAGSISAAEWNRAEARRAALLDEAALEEHKDRVVAGSDCGFGTFAGFGAVDPDIAYAKLEALSQGAGLVSA